MTQELYQAAIRYAGEKHHDQKVPGTNANYLLHLSNVAMEILMAHAVSDDFDVDYAVQVALLHDTLEDTDTDFDDLVEKFGEKVALAVKSLTKDDTLPTKREKMADSLHRINQLDKEVGMVKLADRITNLQKPPEHWTQEKIRNYLNEAKTIAEQLQGKNAYLNQRLRTKIEEYRSYID